MKPREGPPTIYHVAELAGMSISTVSRVLNSPDRVSESTRARVQQAIDQLGYTPKAEARARALQNTHRIGVLTPFFTAPSFVQRLRGIDAALVDTSYELVIYTVESKSRLKGYLTTLPLTGSLDGLIIMSLPFDETDSQRLVNHHLETVVIEFHQRDFSAVEIDNISGGKIAARYLLDKGHRKLAFLGDIDPPDYAIRPVAERYAGFRQALAEAEVHLQDSCVRSVIFDQTASRRAARELLTLPERPTAVFAAADVQAIAVMKVAGELGLRIPQDLAVIGFDDLDMADYVGLTTICQSLDDSGRIAAELLIARLADPNRPVQHVMLPLSIVERETA